MRTLPRRINRATDCGFNHPEAYCVMLYASKDGKAREMIWNSREGVTPFMVMSKDGTVELQHVAWDQDTMWLTWVPDVGSRIFVDLTREMALPIARQRVLRDWDAPEYPMREVFETQDEAVEMLLKGWLEQEGTPHIMEVTEEMRGEFKVRAAEWTRAIQTMPMSKLATFKPDMRGKDRVTRVLQAAEERRQRKMERRARQANQR